MNSAHPIPLPKKNAVTAGSKLSKVAGWLAKGLGLLLLATVALVLLFRWLPVPFSALMLQRQIIAQWQDKPDFRLRHHWVTLDRISPQMVLAAIAAEDQKFLVHNGFDLEAIQKALKANQHRQRPLGASTISQQVAKNLFLWPGRNLLRKGMEAYFTVLIEGLWPKRRIIEVYLNIVEFGPGLFGVEAASQAYFRKPATGLNSTEAARLAAILPSPLRYNPRQPSDYLAKRTWQIQQQMKLLGGTAALEPLGRRKRS